MKKNLACVLIVAATVGLSGCAAAVPEQGPQEAGVATPAPADAPAVNERGNLLKAIGEEGAVTFPGSDRDAINFRVTSIVRDPDCTGDAMWYQPSENGQFVALTFEITTADDYLDLMSAKEPLNVFWQDWISYNAAGEVVDNTASGYGCLPEDQQLEATGFAPGTTTTGVYVVDAPLDAVSVAWTPAYVQVLSEDDRWEWQIP